MYLLRDVPLLRLLRRIVVSRRQVASPVYAVTVPAPLTDTSLAERRNPVIVTQPAPPPRVVNA